jgi:hypothetical protein
MKQSQKNLDKTASALLYTTPSHGSFGLGLKLDVVLLQHY